LATWLRPATYARHHETKRGQTGARRQGTL